APPRVPVLPAIPLGAAIGLLSGLTGTGGGIFLSPILLFAGWTQTRQASGTAAGFILANSIAGLLGNLSRVASLPPELPVWAAVVVIGAVIGSGLGSRGATPHLRGALSVVLLVAGVKLIVFP
ncbi:MAG: TSUP family transporter, partial [Chloroflexota bacterium]|nr:TSUP family transporter [Chloroflexota bacterium]